MNLSPTQRKKNRERMKSHDNTHLSHTTYFWAAGNQMLEKHTTVHYIGIPFKIAGRQARRSVLVAGVAGYLFASWLDLNGSLDNV